jgi:hypothetical protein
MQIRLTDRARRQYGSAPPEAEPVTKNETGGPLVYCSGGGASLAAHSWSNHLIRSQSAVSVAR